MYVFKQLSRAGRLKPRNVKHFKIYAPLCVRVLAQYGIKRIQLFLWKCSRKKRDINEMHVHTLPRSTGAPRLRNATYLRYAFTARTGERGGGGVRQATHSRCPRTCRPVFGGEWCVGRRNERKIYKRKVSAARSRCLLLYCGCVHRVTINYIYG